MVKHIILWKLKDEFNNDSIKQGIKKGLEDLKGKIPGQTDRIHRHPYIWHDEGRRCSSDSHETDGRGIIHG